MRLVEFEETPFENVWQHIETECSDIIAGYKLIRKFLYRGIKSNEKIIAGQSPMNRPPKDSGKAIQAEFDNLLTQCGMVALRSNSIFAVSSQSHAGSYGNLYIVFPKNGFDYTFTNRSDLTLSSWPALMDEDMATKLYDNVDRYFKFHRNEQKLIRYDTFVHYIEDLKSVCKDSKFIQQVTPEELINKDDFMAIYRPQNRNLDLALQTEREVYIHGSYYMISYDYINQIKEKIGLVAQ